MPTNRKRTRRTTNPLKPWEEAFLKNDESFLRPDTRDAARLKTIKADPDAWLLFGDRTARELLKEYPEYKKLVNLPPKNRPVRVESPTEQAVQGFDIEKNGKAQD